MFDKQELLNKLDELRSSYINSQKLYRMETIDKLDTIDEVMQIVRSL